jgi:hypothetical protein
VRLYHYLHLLTHAKNDFPLGKEFEKP